MSGRPDMDSVVVVRRPCFLEEDNGLASLADLEAGFSGNYNNNNNNNNKLYCNSICHSTQICSPRGGFRNRSSWTPRSGAAGRFYDPRFEEERYHHHFLAACFFCKKQLGNNRDIFMYRGDTAFCSEECRQEQIDLDESKEKNKNLSSSMKALRKKQQDQNKKPNSPNRDYNAFHAGAVAAA